VSTSGDIREAYKWLKLLHRGENVVESRRNITELEALF
jgi:hypothetical protein